MSSEPEKQQEADCTFSKQPEPPKEPTTSEDLTANKFEDKEIGQGDSVSSLKDKEIRQGDEKSLPKDKEIAQRDAASSPKNYEIGLRDAVLSPKMPSSSPIHEIQDSKDSDIEVILDSADDDEELHLKWDDDEEIEDDIISLNMPESPPKVEMKSELEILTEKDKEIFTDKDLSEEILVDKDGDGELIVLDDDNKITKTESISKEQSLQSSMLDVDKICAQIDDNIKEIDDDDENQAKNKAILNDNAIKPSSSIDDLILIEDDDNIENNVCTKEPGSVLGTKNITVKEILHEQIANMDIVTNDPDVMEIDLSNDEADNPKHVDKAVIEDNKEKNYTIDNVKNQNIIDEKVDKARYDEDVMEIDLSDDEADKPKDVETAVIASNKDKIGTIDIVKYENIIDEKVDIGTNDQDVMEIDLSDDEADKLKDVATANIEDNKGEIVTVSKTTEIGMVQKYNSANIPVTANVKKEYIITSSPNESLLDASVIGENLEHGLNKPNMMLEIPTQEIIEFLDETDVSLDLNKSNESSEKVDSSDEVTVNDTTLVTNKNDVDSTAADKSSLDTKKLDEKTELTNRDEIAKDLEETKEIEAMNVTESDKETLTTDIKLDSITSKYENVTPIILGEKEPTTDLRKIDKSLSTASETAVQEPSDANTETAVINLAVSTLTETVEKLLKTKSDEEKPSTTLIKTVADTSNTNSDEEKLPTTLTEPIKKSSTTKSDEEIESTPLSEKVTEAAKTKSDEEKESTPISEKVSESAKTKSDEENASTTLTETVRESSKTKSYKEKALTTLLETVAESSVTKSNEKVSTTSAKTVVELAKTKSHEEQPSTILTEITTIAETVAESSKTKSDDEKAETVALSSKTKSDDLIDTCEISQDLERNTEIETMDVKEDNKEIFDTDTNFDSIISKDEDLSSTMLDEKDPTREQTKIDESLNIEHEAVVQEPSDGITETLNLKVSTLTVKQTKSDEKKATITSTETLLESSPTSADQENTSTTLIETDAESSKTKSDNENTSSTLETVAEPSKTNSDGEKTSTTLKETLLESSKTTMDDEKPSTSKEIKAASPYEPKPSTSQDIKPEKSCDMDLGTNEELQEVTDSLGLLAESSRVMEDDEEPEDEEDDDDDFDQDESSNQMTADHSEDSNAQQSESDGAKDQDEKTTDSPQEDKEEFSFAINNIVSVAGKGEEEKDADEPEKEGDMQDKDGDIEVDDIEDEVEVTPEQIGDVSTVEEADAVIAAVADDVVTEDKQDKPSEAKQAVDVETVKLSDTSDNEVEGGLLRNILENQETATTSEKKSPVKKLAIAETTTTAFNFVDLEESSSEDDVQEVNKKESTPLEVKSSAVDLQDIAAAVDVPKTPTKTRTPRINTSEISIRTISSAEAAALPQIQPPEEKPAPKFGLEVFSLDSDEEDATKPEEPKEEKPVEEPPVKPRKHRCINLLCKSAGSCRFLKADAATLAYYDAARKKRTMVCEECANAVVRRTQSLVDGIKEFTPLLHLDIVKLSSELVEISDSESEDEEVVEEVKEKEMIGEKGVKLLEEHLADMLNQTWKKFKLDARLTEAQDMLNDELKMLEEQSKEIDTMLNDCQLATDKLRKELYATFEHDRQEITPLVIFDIPGNKHSYLDTDGKPEAAVTIETPSVKRRLSTSNDTPAKRLHTEPIPLGYTPIDNKDNKDAVRDNTNPQDLPATTDASKLDDDKDISVLQVSAEVAPPSLPPPGTLTRAPLRVGASVFAMRNVFGSWLKGKIIEVQGKTTVPGSTHLFTICRVKFEHNARNVVKLLPGRCLAYSEVTEVRMTIGTRVIALFKDTNDNKRNSFYSGIISEVPNPVNKYRYLVFFDDGYAQYVRHEDTRLVCECATLVWEEVHPYSREFVREYLMAYPERPMVRLHAGQSLKTEWNGKWWSSRVIKVDASLVQVHFEEDNRTEWIYRGSTRLAPLYLELQAAERHRARPMPRTKAQPRTNMPYVEYTRSDEQNKSEESAPPPPSTPTERETRQRAVAKKSTTPVPLPAPAPPISQPAENVTSRVVYYTPKNAVKPHKMSPHTCGPQCKRSDVLALKDLRTYNPLAKPLLSGWERQIVRFKGHKEVMYRAPCGRRLRNMRELHRYLRTTRSDMAVDLFDFAPGTHCLAEFVLNSCLVGKKDLSHGKENVPVPCVNYYDDSLPEFCSYNTERTPTAGVPLNLDPEFLCGCDCIDDCEDKSKCACWRMTLEGARTIGLDASHVGYVYRRLPEPLPTGIYECNSRCKCKQTCLNRVAQHPLQLKLQVFKTLNRGWGIRALNDVPKGSFLCVYAGNLLTDATANMDGLNEGDEYLAELDYIEVVEQMKEGFEEDIPDADKKLDKKNQAKASDDDSEEISSSEEEDTTRDDREDDDFRPAASEILRITQFSKRLRKREKKKQQEDEKQKEKEKEASLKNEDDCITISDDEEVREPSRFMAQAGMASNEFKSKYRSVRSYFGKDEACYIMDAKVQGNIGRYLNHSCTPNVFVQNVFVDTHDPRFPWVAFFALCHIKAGTELTWNYNYDVGSVPGKVLYCYCGAPNCRGRLL